MTVECRICAAPAAGFAQGRILGKYLIQYFRCPACGFVQTETPHWLDEAYKVSINLTDTGILDRNSRLARKTAVLLWFLGLRRGLFLDYAGGYGLFTRIMRDTGFDFRWYDPFTQNLVARGFEYDPGAGAVDMITSFESFEHFVDPKAEVAKMLAHSRSILFSTETLPHPAPKPGEWWYYGLEHGQHVSFYTPESLRRLAAGFGLRYFGNGRNLHLFTDRQVGALRFKILTRADRLPLYRFVASRMPSLIVPDMERMISEMERSRR